MWDAQDAGMCLCVFSRERDFVCLPVYKYKNE